ncbi:hypothetical protein ACVCL3_07260 [Rhodanobacter sp. UC4437_H4]
MFNADELAHYGAEITRLTIVLNTQTKPLAERSTYDRADKGTEVVKREKVSGQFQPRKRPDR